jgi:tetratricopeptide (TPR) repeat protein
MKTMTMSLIALVLLTSAILAQRPPEIKSAGMDLLGALSGDTQRFERGMKTLEEALAKNPKDPEVKVLWGNGILARAGLAFSKGDIANGLKLWQSGLDEMAQAVELAPENIYVRARRGVVMIAASRSTPPEMAKPILELAVSDFEKVLQIREKENTFSQNSTHKRGELLTSLADGWNRLGNLDKARPYFERITKELKGTVYEQRANAWLEGKPEAKGAAFFACSGCHVE